MRGIDAGAHVADMRSDALPLSATRRLELFAPERLKRRAMRILDIMHAGRLAPRQAPVTLVILRSKPEPAFAQPRHRARHGDAVRKQALGEGSVFHSGKDRAERSNFRTSRAPRQSAVTVHLTLICFKPKPTPLSATRTDTVKLHRARCNRAPPILTVLHQGNNLHRRAAFRCRFFFGEDHSRQLPSSELRASSTPRLNERNPSSSRVRSTTRCEALS